MPKAPEQQDIRNTDFSAGRRIALREVRKLDELNEALAA
jgi:hypothetical protein